MFHNNSFLNKNSTVFIRKLLFVSTISRLFEITGTLTTLTPLSLRVVNIAELNEGSEGSEGSVSCGISVLSTFQNIYYIFEFVGVFQIPFKAVCPW